MQEFDHSAEPPDRDTFARLIIASIRKAGEKKQIRYDPEAFTLKADGSNISQASMGNVYGEYCRSSPEARARIVRNFVRSWFAPLKGIPDDFEDAQHDILPSIRARSFIEINLIKLRSQGIKDADWAYAPVGQHLALSLVYDLPESIMSIQKQHLDDWGVSFDDALQRAATNLMDISGHLFDQPAPGVWRSPWHDNHDSARLILLPLLLAHEVTGDHVAMVPNRDTLLLTGADDVEGLVALAALAEEAYDHPRAISGMAVRLVGDTLEPFLPPEDHPAYPAFRRLWVHTWAGDYDSQKKALEAKFEEEEEDVFVASCTVAEKKDGGELFTYSVWSEGVDTLLPMTGRVFFYRPGEDEEEKGKVLGMAEWNRVAEVVGDLLVEEDYYPPRFRAREFPSDEMLAELFPGEADPE